MTLAQHLLWAHLVAQPSASCVQTINITATLTGVHVSSNVVKYVWQFAISSTISQQFIGLLIMNLS